MKSCKTCAFVLDYELSPACEKCFHHSNWLAKPEKEATAISNAEHIRSMSDEELADWIVSFGSICAICSGVALDCGDGSKACGCCSVGVANWLKQPKEKEE